MNNNGFLRGFRVPPPHFLQALCGTYFYVGTIGIQHVLLNPQCKKYLNPCPLSIVSIGDSHLRDDMRLF